MFLDECLPTSGVRKQRALDPGWQGFDLRCHYEGVSPCRSPFRLENTRRTFRGARRNRSRSPVRAIRSRRLSWEAFEDRIALAGLTAFVDPDPAPGNHFGATVVTLSTGNVVITSPFDNAGGTGAGAVYLFNGTTGALISTLTGSHAGDNIGSGGVTALSDGNFVVDSPDWTNGTAADAGAVTWGSGTAGVSGAVSATNSLVGSTANDYVGSARRDGPEQRQLRGEQPRLDQRRGRRLRARSRGAAARPASAAPSVPRTAWSAVRRMTLSATAA